MTKPRPTTRPDHALLAAIQFLTRIPTPSFPFTQSTLPAALAFFPWVGLALGALAALTDTRLLRHLPPVAAALGTVAVLILITGALHEDGLADCADAFGSHHPRARTLDILRDSRIGTFGALALILSIAARVTLITALPAPRIFPTLLAAHALARWSSLPLTLLPPARADSGQGVKVAQQTPRSILVLGTLSALAITLAALRQAALPAIAATLAVTTLTALFYRRRLQGITGDCFGATNQLVEIAILTCGAWGTSAWVK